LYLFDGIVKQTRINLWRQIHWLIRHI